jgi:hypothetical protein
MKPLLFALATFLSTPSFAFDCPTNKDGILFVIQRYETKIGPFSSSFDAYKYAINFYGMHTNWHIHEIDSPGSFPIKENQEDWPEKEAPGPF